MIFDHAIPCPHCGGSVPIKLVQTSAGGGGGPDPTPASSPSRLAAWWRGLWPDADPIPPIPAALVADREQQFEQAYEQGGRAAWQRLLGLALVELSAFAKKDTEHSDAAAAVDRARLVAEREAAVAQLRMLCRDFGDNDWQPNEHLADVVDKHLGRHLHAADMARGKP